MYKISIKRIFEFKCPFEFYWRTHDDWTHFTNLHRKSHRCFRLLHKEGNREIFLYKTWIFFPLPFYDTYIVFRKYHPSGDGYRAIYLNIRTGRVNYLNGRAFPKGDSAVSVGEFLFSVSSFWRFFPKLFFWLFQWRGREILEEDNWWIAEMMALGKDFRARDCGPKVPETYDLFDDLYGAGELPASDSQFDESAFFDLEKQAASIKAHRG